MSTGIDMSQFHAIFFEECMEGIEVMESGLLNLDEASDTEVINTIFRAAHSIKGGGSTFGFPEISEFTHGIETILDEMRNGHLNVTRKVIDLLLASVDCLRNMIRASEKSKGYDQDTILQMKQQLDSMIVAVPESSISVLSNTKNTTEDSAFLHWKIKFFPHEDLFFTGNDPYRLIKELQSMGELDIKLITDKLPDFSTIKPQNSYLGWQMMLQGNISERQLEEVFIWVQGDCDLEISLVDDSALLMRQSGSEDVTAKQGRRKTDSPGQESVSIRVGIDKVDDLVNLVGELVITQSILSRNCESIPMEYMEKINANLEQLERNTRDLQERAMSIRMLPIDFAFQRLPRVVHDLSLTLGKRVELKFSGRTTELDKTVLEKIGDPLMHLVRNALDHGIEKPEERVAAGKPEKGLINIAAYHQGGNIIVEIDDDGAGLNEEKILNKAIENNLVDENTELSSLQLQNLIFQPGFSTAVEVSNISGRGVGMDVVKQNITDLGGSVGVFSRQGEGCKFTIRLPLTLAILDGQMVRVSDQIYIIPLLSIIESVQLVQHKISAVVGESELYQYRDEYIHVVRLHQLFNIQPETTNLKDEDHHEILVIIDVGHVRMGVLVDEVLGQQQIVIKSLKKNFRQVQCLAGATILGDGSVALILDVHGLKTHQPKINVTQSLGAESLGQRGV